MPETATTEQNQSPLEGFKAHLDEQLQRLGEKFHKVDELDGRVEEALHLARKAGTPEEVIDQLQRLGQRVDAFEAGDSLPKQGDSASKLLRSSFAGSAYMKRIRARKRPEKIQPGTQGLLVPSHIMRARGLRRATPLIGTTDLGLPVTYAPGVTPWQLEPTRLVDLVPTTPCNTETFSFLKEDRISGEGGIAKNVNGPITGGAGAVITLDDVNNIIAGSTAYIARTNGSGMFLGYEECTVQSINTSTMVVTMTASIAGDVADNDKIVFTSYAGTAESGQKPYIYVKTAWQSETMVTTAVLVNTTRQAMLFDPTLESFIQGKARRTSRRNKSRLLLYGTGTAPQIQGFLTLTGRQTYNWSSGSTGDVMADCVYKAILLIPDEDGGVDVTLSRTDFQRVASEKKLDGGYVHGTTAPILIVDKPGLKSIGPYMAHTDSQLKANGDFLCAVHERASVVAVADNGEFLFGYMDDDFGTNEITGRYEEVELHAIKSTQDYVHGNFDSRP